MISVKRNTILGCFTTTIVHLTWKLVNCKVCIVLYVFKYPQLFCFFLFVFSVCIFKYTVMDIQHLSRFFYILRNVLTLSLYF